MVRTFAGAALWLPLLALQAQHALAHAASTTTAYVVVTTTTTWDYAAASTELVTTTRTVHSYYTPTAHVTATSTYTNAMLDLEVVQLYVPAGSVDNHDLVYDIGLGMPKYGGDGGTRTYWVAPITYTAPASCPTPFTVKTTDTVSLAASRTADLHPTSTKASTGIWGPEETLYLSELPSGVSPAYGHSYREYIANCETPPSGPRPSSYGDHEVCLRLRGHLCMKWRYWIIVLSTVLPGLFVLGFLESFFWFRQLMRGRRALRLGTLCWTFCSGWVACFTRVSPARDVADQPALVEQWKAMSAREKWLLWLKWGFRYKYPVELLGPDPRKIQLGGAVPATKGEEGVQQVQQTQQVEETTPTAPVVR
ncbi:hypothetical protein PG993_006890 [Apiospora rasikravindrae]|uniref:Uncharacterized protein n=1 Tax=Apiospora rasikravindrae TaxID=990691 RepID=A0ABR1SXM7_9PEZI